MIDALTQKLQLSLLAFVVFASATIGSAALFATRSESDTGTRAPGASVLKAPKEAVPESSRLVLDAVQANAFMTTFHLVLALQSARGGNDTIAVHPEDITMAPAPTDSQQAEVSVGGGSDGYASLTLTTGPLPSGTADVNVSLRRYFVLPGGRDGVEVRGAWHASGRVDLSAVPSSTSVSTGGGLDSGQGWRYVVDSVATDGTAVSLTYHLEGSIDGLRTLGQVAQLLLEDGTAVNADGGPNTGSTPETVHFATTQSLAGASVRFPPLLREHAESHDVTLVRDGDGWTGSVTVGGEESEASVTQSGGFIHVAIAGPQGGHVAVTGSVAGATIRDAEGGRYDLYHGSEQYPDNSPNVSRITATLDFEGELPASAGSLTLSVGGYREVLRGDWTLPLD